MKNKNKRKVRAPDVTVDSWNVYKDINGKTLANCTLGSYTVSHSAANEKAARAKAQRCMNETYHLHV
ncbi:hypothetical protein COPG_00125 [Colwellia phage 9A]|uniref:Uncharacterized protein n=1 Tax=Colwellia phage 9A TaxID=765765 RepID=I3UMK6_9CAUD|nr:hypothetical protein COPG_00125 [Colwellia phage 9A]AFK66721.1 hypothetical protein COPG_00125 [Colwellia phage 9A]